MTNITIHGSTTIEGLSEILKTLNYYLTEDGQNKVEETEAYNLAVNFNGNKVKFDLIIDEYEATIEILENY